jgi:polysaccharide biosynthesis/export protein
VVDLRSLTDTYQIQEGDVVIVPKQGIVSALEFAARLIAPMALLFGFPGL